MKITMYRTTIVGKQEIEFENKKEWIEYLINYEMNGPEWTVNFKRDSISKIAENLERETDWSVRF